MKRKTHKKGFTIVELVIVIAVIAILATTLVPSFGNVIQNAKDSAAKQEAKNAYTSYMVANAGKGEMPELFLYKAEEGRVVAIRNGAAVGIYVTPEEALTALGLEEDTVLTNTSDGKLFICGCEANKKAVICFTIDDGNSDDDDIYTVFKNYGFVCNFALPTTVSGNYQQYLNYQDEGFEIISHSTDGSGMNDSSLSESNIENKLKNSKTQLEAAGFEIHSWVTPSSQMHEKFLPLVKRYYDYAFTVYLGDWDEDANGNMTPYNTLDDDVYKLHRVSMESTSLERVKLAIDEAVENTGYLNFYAHKFANDAMDQAKLEAILEYVKGYVDSGKCIVTTVTEGFKYYYDVELKDDVGTEEPEEPTPGEDDDASMGTAVDFTYEFKYCASSVHSSRFGALIDDAQNRFGLSSVFEVKAGQTVIVHAGGTHNIAILFECEEDGTPKTELIIGGGTQNTVKEYIYTATKDMYCRSSNNITVVPADQWTVTLKDAEKVEFSTTSGFYASVNHPNGFGGMPEPGNGGFYYSSIFEVKAGQTVVMYASFNSNVAGLLRTNESGTPIGQLLTGSSSSDYNPRVWTYTATEDMYCVACTREGAGYLPNLSDWVIYLQDPV